MTKTEYLTAKGESREEKSSKIEMARTLILNRGQTIHIKPKRKLGRLQQNSFVGSDHSL